MTRITKKDVRDAEKLVCSLTVAIAAGLRLWLRHRRAGNWAESVSEGLRAVEGGESLMRGPAAVDRRIREGRIEDSRPPRWG